MYAQVNTLFGDIVKVTPTSKAVGDMALFMVANNLTPEDVLDTNRELAFPASVVDLIGGRMGQPLGGFPEEVQKIILKGESPVLERPGASMEPADFGAAKEIVKGFLKREPLNREVVSYLLYPQVFEEYAAHTVQYTDTSMLPTPAFFYGLEVGEEIAIDIEKGKTLIISFVSVSDPNEDGMRLVSFELNGQPRNVSIKDLSIGGSTNAREQADPANSSHIGSSMPGMVVKVFVEPGDKVTKGQKLLVLEAMKMETTIYAEQDGDIKRVLVAPGQQVETGDLLVDLS